ncbi:MAG: hypothetical protein V7607_5669 [Solirubrobacteraceae bacterium]
METWDATVAVPASCRLGESPWWDAQRERLVWVDIPEGLVHAHEPSTGAMSTSQLDDAVGFAVGRKGGGFVAGTAAGLVELDDDLRPTGPVDAPPDLDEHRRINDGACDPHGRVLLGTVDRSAERTGTLWSRGLDGAFEALAIDVGMSNGLAFSPDGGHLYYVDTTTQQVDRFDYNPVTGRASRRSPFCRVAASVGLPDGLAVDAVGCVWVAIWGAGEVWRLSPEGERIGTAHVPASRTTCCAFGGTRRNRLYVTTASEGGDDREVDRDGAPGAVFAVEVGVRGARVFPAAARAAAVNGSLQATRNGE